MDPPVTATGDRAQHQWQAQLTQVLRTGLGQSKDKSGKFLTWLDLEDQGIVVSTGGSGGGHIVNPDSGGGMVPEEDRTPPPAPENVSADGGMTAIYVTWDDPGLDYNYRVEIHRSAVDDVGTAILHGSGIGTIYQDVVGSDKTLYYYWARFVKQLSTDIIIGPWNQTAGTPGQAGEDPAWVLDQISGKFDTDDLKTQVFTVDLFGVKGTDPSVERMAFAIDTTTTPPRVAMDGAYIIDATIGDAKIENLTVDKLIGGTADFVEANIRDGSITNAKIGNYIQSGNFQTNVAGWQINKNGHAEFMDIYARGLIEGSIIRGSVIEGGLLIDSGVTLTVPTEADNGPDTRRFLCLAGKEVSGATPPFEYNTQVFFNLASADYTDDGWGHWGDGQKQEEVWNNFDRYKPYVIQPVIVLEGETDLSMRCYGESFKWENPVITVVISVYGVKKNGQETFITNLSVSVDPKKENGSFDQGFYETIYETYTARCCDSSQGDGTQSCTTHKINLGFDFKLTISNWNISFKGNYYKLKYTCNRSVVFNVSDVTT